MNYTTFDLSGYTREELIELGKAELAQADAWNDVVYTTRSHKRRADASTEALKALNMAQQCACELGRR